MIHRASGDDNIVIDAAATDGCSRTFRPAAAAAVTKKSITSAHIFYPNNTITKTEN